MSKHHDGRKKLLETLLSKQFETGAFCSQGSYVHMLSSLFDTLATFNTDTQTSGMQHYIYIYLKLACTMKRDLLLGR